MNNASSRNLALSSFIGPEPQQQLFLHAIMLLLSPWCSCSEGPVAWWSRIKRTVLGRNGDKMLVNDSKKKSYAIQCNSQAGNNRVVQAFGFGILLMSVYVQSKSRSFSQTRPLTTSQFISIGCTKSRLPRCSERRMRCAQQPVDAESRDVVLSGPASPKKSPPLSARFTHRGLTTNMRLNLQPLSITACQLYPARYSTFLS